MDPAKVFCPNEECPARGQVGKGNIRVHSRKERRYRCTVCGKTFSERKGTIFYWKKHAAELIVVVVTLLAYGCPVQAIVAAFGLKAETVRRWAAEAGGIVSKYTAIWYWGLVCGCCMCRPMKYGPASRPGWCG